VDAYTTLGAGRQHELQEDAYAECIRVDVSLVAIGKAGARDERIRRRGKHHYVCADILTYVSPHKFNVILFRDSIYYLPKARIKATLDSYSNALKEGGVCILRLCDELRRCTLLLVRSTETSQ
jgi:hypothetical protein